LLITFSIINNKTWRSETIAKTRRYRKATRVGTEKIEYMNRVIFKSITVLSLAFIIFSCKKEDAEKPFKKIATITDSDGRLYRYEYNSAGKLSKINYGGEDYRIYTYSKDTVTTLDYYNGVTTRDTLILNQQGYVKEWRHGWTKDIYEYNSDGYAIKRTSTYKNANPFTTTYKYSEGNLILFKNEYPQNPHEYSYEHYLDKETTLNSAHYGINFYGKSSKNPTKHETLTSKITTEVYDYTYEYDQDNYITKLTQTTNNSIVTWKTYTYK
jgi:YD repeat-containing protein